jgi:hypothetical protein
MRYLCIGPVDQSSLEQSLQLVRALPAVVKKAQKLELKHAFCEALSHVFGSVSLRSCAKDLDLSLWQAPVHELLAKTFGWAKKGKHLAAALPAVCELLGVCSADQFRKTMPLVLDAIFKAGKDAAVRGVAMNCASRFLRVYISLYAEADGPKASRDLFESVRLQLIFGPKKQSYPFEAIPMFINLLLTIAGGDLDWLLSSTLIDLLADTS